MDINKSLENLHVDLKTEWSQVSSRHGYGANTWKMEIC